MARNLEPVAFDAARFQGELDAFGALLASKTAPSETKDIQRFFKKNKHLSAYLGTFSPNIGPATELAFHYPFFGNFQADLVLGNKSAGEFAVVEFEDGRQDSIFKKQPRRGHPEWSARFEHGFSQLVDWFYSLDDFKGNKDFAATFGSGHVRFTGVLIIGRSANLDEKRRNRLNWRSEKILIDSHAINCITFDQVHEVLQTRFELFRSASKHERK